MLTSCTYDPRPLAGQPIGMFHCPECGCMVIAGMPHPDWSLLDEMGGDGELDPPLPNPANVLPGPGDPS